MNQHFCSTLSPLFATQYVVSHREIDFCFTILRETQCLIQKRHLIRVLRRVKPCCINENQWHLLNSTVVFLTSIYMYSYQGRILQRSVNIKMDKTVRFTSFLVHVCFLMSTVYSLWFLSEIHVKKVQASVWGAAWKLHVSLLCVLMV